MNIKITYNWLLEYLDTDASPQEIQQYLSLCGPSVERVEKIGDDFVFDIEITSNRVDAASVLGVAQEAQAILPQFQKRAKLKKINIPYPAKPASTLPIQISDPDGLTNRVVAVVLDNVQIGPSPEFIKKRLESCGIRSLNNIIDITNYVMLEIGHPTHAFDYDRIKGHTLIFRKAKRGEKVVTLDGKEHKLDENDVVIDDGTGKIIDLPGIMGTKNSVITDKTKRVLFFIENNDSQIIRKTSMRLGIRTEAATINDKGPDPERAKTALLRGIQLYQEITKAKVGSDIIDIYPHPYTPKKISVAFKDFYGLMGVRLEQKIIIDILTSLGFTYHPDNNREKMLTVEVPSYRKDDINIPQDLVEEVARVYGYHNLPNNLQQTVSLKQPKPVEKLFHWQQKIKYLLKHIGLHEVMNYSMVSKELLETFSFDPKESLRLANTISTEIEYLRPSVLPSLAKNIKENTGKKDVLKFFEIAKAYHPRDNDLPYEGYKLGIVVNTNYSDLKGIVETLLKEMHLEKVDFAPGTKEYLLDGAHIIYKEDSFGHLGKLKPVFQEKMRLVQPVYLAELDFEKLAVIAKYLPSYQPINPYAVIKLDLTITKAQENIYSNMIKNAKGASPLLRNVELLDIFQDKITLRFYFSALDRNLTDEEAKEELEKIKKAL